MPPETPRALEGPIRPAFDTYGGSTAVVLIDLDHFMYVNDALGHQVGDRFIAAIAGGLRRRLRDSDVVCRLGGDEFAVLLPGAGVPSTVEVADSLLADIRATEVEQDGQRVRTTGSAGLTVLHADPDEARTGRDVDGLGEGMMSQADLAMYAAKEAGGDCHVVFDPAGPHTERSRARFRWLEQIRVALDQEITETTAIANFEAAQALAHRLTAIGCRFALDDFGAGYGSFYYLKHLPFAYLKIDGEFIRHLTSSDTDQIIVSAIVGAARAAREADHRGVRR